MPIIQSAIKRARQNEKRRFRLLPYRTHMKTMIRSTLDLIQEKKIEEACTLLPRVYKAIDIAAKKRIIHKKTAAHKKSRLARLLHEISRP